MTYTAELQRPTPASFETAADQMPAAPCTFCFDSRTFTAQDPITALVMRADGVTEGDLQTLLYRIGRSRESL